MDLVLPNDKTYKVLMVLHYEYPEYGSDVYVKYLGNKLDCVDRLGSEANLDLIHFWGSSSGS